MTDPDRRTWAYGPGGEAQIFDSPDDVPRGWQDRPFAVAGTVVSEPATEAVAEAADADPGDEATEAPKRRGRPPKVR